MKKSQFTKYSNFFIKAKDQKSIYIPDNFIMSAQNIYIYTRISATTVHFPLGGVNVKMKILLPINHMRIILLAPLEGKSVEEFSKNK